jgi:hypothetical protein
MKKGKGGVYLFAGDGSNAINKSYFVNVELHYSNGKESCMRLVTISEEYARFLGESLKREGGWIMTPGEEMEGSIAVRKLMQDPESIFHTRYVALLPDSLERDESELLIDREQLLTAINMDIANCEKMALKGFYSALDWGDAWRKWKSIVSLTD